MEERHPEPGLAAEGLGVHAFEGTFTFRALGFRV